MNAPGFARTRFAAPMRSFFGATVVAVSIAAVGIPSLAFAQSPPSTSVVAHAPRDEAAFKQWLQTEMSISFTKMLANISPAGTVPGVVIASTQTANPNYYYNWVRDGALVMDVIVRNLIAMQEQQPSDALIPQWRQMMDTYASFSRANQLTNAPSGLGEPKFNVDGTPYTFPWGRPQNDSPALRASVLSRFAFELLREGQTDYVHDNLYDGFLPSNTVIKNDLEYVAHHWSDASYDPWEEVLGDHFYTRIVQYAAMLNGSALAAQMQDTSAANFYAQQANAIRASLANFWDPSVGFLRVTLNQQRGVSKFGLDSQVILGVLHADIPVGATTEFTVLDSRVMATAEKIRASFAPLYPINTMIADDKLGTAIGRYPEDFYSGTTGLMQGNPWVLSTAGFAEYDYKLATAIAAQPSFTVDATNIAFVQNVLGNRTSARSLAVGLALPRGSAGNKQLIAALIARGDQYMERVRRHQFSDGSLSEQIDRYTGYMTSAANLSWSYVSVITAGWARPEDR